MELCRYDTELVLKQPVCAGRSSSPSHQRRSRGPSVRNEGPREVGWPNERQMGARGRAEGGLSSPPACPSRFQLIKLGGGKRGTEGPGGGACTCRWCTPPHGRVTFAGRACRFVVSGRPSADHYCNNTYVPNAVKRLNVHVPTLEFS